MIERKKRIQIIQIVLFILGILIIYFTYYNKETKNIQQSNTKIINESKSDNEDEDVFFNIEYTGLDLNGNRYLLKSKEARLDEQKSEIVYMKDVSAIFYFKDNTILYVWSDIGTYNNKNFDMKFDTNVRAEYMNSKLFAEKAHYSNSENFLSIYDNFLIYVSW